MTAKENSEALRNADRATRERSQRVFDRPLVVEAGAGTGKTSLLVARIVAWALGEGWERAATRLAGASGELPSGRAPGHPSPPEGIAAEVFGRIAAITFTDAAAAEMARRTGSALVDIEAGKIPTGVYDWALPTAADVRRTRARALLGALDHLLVRTIHAFCRRLLAQYPLEAGLHPAFQVDADEVVRDEVVREVVEATVRAAYSDPGDPDLLALAVEGIGPARIEAALARLVAAGISPDAFEADPFVPEQITALRGGLGETLAAFQREDGGRLAATDRRSTRTHATCAAIDSTAALIDAAAPASLADLESFAGALRECWQGAARARLDDWSRGKFNKGERDVLGDDAGALSRRAADLAILVVHVCDLAPERLERARLSLRPLLARAMEEMRLRGAATYDTLLRDARDLLRDHPDVRERVRGEIEQLLVDEFQDTDPLQCDIIRWIALEGPDAERPGFFLVGDPKQSIFGWRKADLGAYDHFVEEVLGASAEPDRLSVNFRSLPAVLDEVERTIAPVMEKEKGLQPAFQRLIPCAERAAAAAPGPAVEHWVSWAWDRDAAQPEFPNAVRAAKLEAETLARDLRARHDQGEFLWREVGVLFRSTGDLEIYLRELRSAAIPYAVERDRSYYRRREIIEASALLRCVLDRNDHLALLTWLRSASVGVPDAALLPLWIREFPRRVTALHGADPGAMGSLGEMIDAVAADLPDDVPGIDRVRGWEESLRQALAAIGVLRASFEEDPVDVFVEKLRTLSLVEVTEAARFLGAFRVANLDRFFCDLLAELETGGDQETLLRRLRSGVAMAREAEEARPSEAADDAVRVMTIHKAKGLGFKHTYVVQLHKQSGRGSRDGEETFVEEWDGRFEYRLFGAPTLGFHAVERQRARVAAAERVRSLYVAMTRAEDRLVLMGNWKSAAPSVEPEAARTHLDLVTSRRPGIPDLAAHMGRLASGDGGAVVDDADGRWVFPALGAAASEPSAIPLAPVELPSAEVLRAAGEALRARRAAARERARRPWNTAAAADSHADAREEQTIRRFGDGPPAAFRAPDSRPRERSHEAARAAGTAVHRILEGFDLAADPEKELARQQRRLPDLVGALVGEGERAAALQRAEEVVAELRRGRLLSKLCGLAEHVVSRELPVLLPPAAEERRAVAFVAGSIDLCYRDPETAEWVVADYKTDRVVSDADVAERVALYTDQGRSYQRALREAFGLQSDPRFELWFLDADRVEVVA
jgi:ATP-dependent helicase/nuclease subunit A